MATNVSVNPSEETISIGPLGIRFLLTGDDTDGSVSVFEVTVPAGQKLAAPAHRNDAAGGPPNAARMVEVLRRHGMKIAAPPSAGR